MRLFYRQLKQQLNNLLTAEQKKRMLVLSFLMFFGAMLEAVGVSVIVPFITLIMGEEGYGAIPVFGPLLTAAGITSGPVVNAAVIFMLIAVYVLKALYLVMEHKMQAVFIRDCRRHFHDRTASFLLTRPYTYFLAGNTADIQRALASDIRKTSRVIGNVLALLAEIMICLMITAALFFIDPVMSAAVLVMILVAVALINLYIRVRLAKAGRLAAENEKQHIKWVTQGFSGIKEIKHLHAEGFIAERLRAAETVVSEAEAVKSFLRGIPRIVVETICICGMLAVLAVMALRGRQVTSFLPVLGAFAMAAFKLLPSADRIMVAISDINYDRPALENLTEILGGQPGRDGRQAAEAAESADESAGAGNKEALSAGGSPGPERADTGAAGEEDGCMVSFRNVSYRYPDTEKNILDNVSLEIHAGETVGIIGTSGAGKTTLVDLLLGLLVPDSGTVTVRSARIGYIPQNLFMLDDTVRANVAFAARGEETEEGRVWQCLREAQIEEHFRSAPEGLDLRMGERGVRLPGGQVQRIGIARALYREPELLVLDEATSALDPETEAAVMETVNSLHGKRTIVIVAHAEAALTGCDAVYRVENGKLAAQCRSGEKWIL